LTAGTRRELLSGLVGIVLEAGTIVMRHYAGPAVHREKEDHSPVTAADEEAEELILRRLGELAPHIPVIAEESAAAGRLSDISGGTFFLVDPLDGTKEFLSRNGEFTVNIALVENGVPTAGVVFAPAINRLFWGCDAQSFERNTLTGKSGPVAVRDVPAGGLTAVASRSHRDSATDDFLASYQVADLRAAGSSLKFCVLAAGEADIYPRLGRTMEWDTAAGDAVLRAAGGRVTLVDGTTPLLYGNADRGFANPSFVAWGKATRARA
jgi:3'(2'),5'-bisphosphate nucleotidase